MTNEQALAAKLAVLPNLSKLIRIDERVLRTLAEAWELGARDWSEPHPFIVLLLNDRLAGMRETIEQGLAVLPPLNSDTFRKRVICATRTHADIAAAISELLVACRLALVGASVRMIAATKTSRTPDLAAFRGDAEITLEVYGFQSSDDAKEAADKRSADFHSWKRGMPVPESIKGHARLGSHYRSLEECHRPYGDGSYAQRVNRLAGKLVSKADGGQLAGCSNGVLVVATWDTFGPSPGDLESTESGHTPILRAALFGQVGDLIRGAEEFEGGPCEVGVQAVSGVLARASDAKAIIWLFHSGSIRLLESSTGGLSEGARALLLEAFCSENLG